MAVAFRAAGSFAGNATAASQAITAPACQAGDILIAAIINKSATANAVSPPDGTWTAVIATDVTDCTTAADDHQTSLFWKRATGSGGSFTFTKAVDDNVLFGGVIVAYSGAMSVGSPLDATAAVRTKTVGAADNVSFAAYDPTSTDNRVIYVAFYGNDLTTFAAAMSNDTNPDCTIDVDVESSTGNDCSIAFTSGTNNGAAIASRTWASASSADAGNTGIVFALVADTAQTWAGSSGTLTATGTAGSFTPGAATWTGSAGTLTATGTAGAFSVWTGPTIIGYQFSNPTTSASVNVSLPGGSLEDHWIVGGTFGDLTRTALPVGFTQLGFNNAGDTLEVRTWKYKLTATDIANGYVTLTGDIGSANGVQHQFWVTDGEPDVSAVSNGIDGGGSDTTATIPSVTTTTADEILLVGAGTRVTGSSWADYSEYGTPDRTANATYISAFGGRKNVLSAGATGTETVRAVGAVFGRWVSFAIAVKTQVLVYGVSGVEAWWDISDDTAVDFGTGTLLAGVDDKSGNGNSVAQATATNQPDRAATQNSLDAATWNGTDNWMTAASPIAANDSGFYMFGAVKMNGTGSRTIIAGVQEGVQLRVDNSGNLNVLRTDTQDLGSSDGTVNMDDGQWHTFSVYISTTSRVFRIDGVACGSNSTVAGGSLLTYEHIGARYDLASELGSMIVGELLTTTADIGTTDRDTIEAALDSKWIPASGLTWTGSSGVLTATGAAGVFFETFPETWTGTDGTPWSSFYWEAAEADGSGGGTRTIQSNKGRVVTSGGGSYDGLRSRLKPGLGVPGNFDATIDVGWTSLAGTASAQFVWDFRNNFFGEGFKLHVRQSGGVWYWDLYSITGYVNTSRANGTVTPPANSGDTWRFRVYCYGSAVKVKWWNTSGGEPGTWQAEITESNAASETGMQFTIGQHENTTSMTFDLDNLDVQESSIPSQTWAGSAGTLTATGTAGSFTPGAATWTGSAGTLTATGTAGSFSAGNRTWAGSAGTLTATGAAGSFTPGAATWTGSAGLLTATGVAGIWTQMWAGSAGVLTATGSAGSFTAGAVTWTGSAGVLTATGTAGSFTPGAATWTGSAGTLTATGAAGSFTPGARTWTGSAGTLTATGAAGSFTPGAAIWTGSAGLLTATGVAGIWTQTWAGSVGTLTATGTAGSFTPGAATWTGSSGLLTATGTAGSFSSDSAPWTGSNGVLTATGAAGSFTAGAVTWTGSAGTLTATGSAGSFSAGNKTWAGSSGLLTATGVTGIWTQGWPGSSGLLTATGTAGSFTPDEVTWVGSAGVLTVTGSPGQFTAGAGSQGWAGSPGVLTATGAAGAFLAGAVVWNGSTGVFVATGTSGQFVAGTVTWNSATGTLIATGVSGSFQAGEIIWTGGSTATLVATGVPGEFIVGGANWTSAGGLLTATGIPGEFTSGAVVWVGSMGLLTASGLAGTWVVGQLAMKIAATRPSRRTTVAAGTRSRITAPGSRVRID